MKIKKITGKIVQVVDISKTAKEIHIALPEPLEFIPGSFVNVFMAINGEKIRRAYSISSSSLEQNMVTITMRLSPSGVMSPLFWNQDMVGASIEVMGPLGLNTVDKMIHNKVYLFAFGVGAGVVKSIADYFSHQKNIAHMTIATGSRSEDEILYQGYFDQLAESSDKISVIHVVSVRNEGSTQLEGYIQHHIGDFDFNHADVYVCGQEVACAELVEKIKNTKPIDCAFFIEAFH